MPADFIYAGSFITFEGGEGSGKSTLAKKFINQLESLNKSYVFTREPGGSDFGEAVRQILLEQKELDMSIYAEALLFAAERAQHVHTVIKPALLEGKIVVCDRYLDSSLAYQGIARELGLDTIRDISLWGTQNLIPDWTVLLDVPPGVGLERRAHAGGVDRLDKETFSFHMKVREGFLKLAEQDPKRFSVFDATLGTEMLAEQIWGTWQNRVWR